MDLRGADDVLEVELDSRTGPGLVNVVGGLGNDAIKVKAEATQTVRGAEGDDALSTAGIGNRPVTLDGGPGRDLVDYLGGGDAPSGSVPGGVTASLTTGTARWLYGRHPTQGDTARQDTLVGIERLSGTEFGDSLTGGTGADELIGEAGPDNLDGLDGNDTLAGGDGEDAIVGGNGTDALDGGKQVDEFRTGLGGDTVNSRDAFVERVSCTTARETVINDLVDALDNAVNCASVSTAAAKHRFDTVLVQPSAENRRAAASARARGLPEGQARQLRRHPAAAIGADAAKRGRRALPAAAWAGDGVDAALERRRGRGRALARGDPRRSRGGRRRPRQAGDAARGRPVAPAQASRSSTRLISTRVPSSPWATSTSPISCPIRSMPRPRPRSRPVGSRQRPSSITTIETPPSCWVACSSSVRSPKS